MTTVDRSSAKVNDPVYGEGYQERKMKELISNIIFYFFVFIVVMFCSLPFIWAIGQSFIDSNALGTRHIYFPIKSDQFTTFNYEFVLNPARGITVAMLNSFIVASITTVLCVSIGASSSYVLAQFDFKLRTGLLGLILSMTMFPVVVIIVPLYVEYLFLKRQAGIELINSFPGVILPYIVFNLPLTVYLLFNFFQEIPAELVSAARVDGASDFQIFRKVILPLAIPGVFTTAILVFIAAWNEFLIANLMLQDVDKRTVPVALSYFQGIPPIGVIMSQNLARMAATVVVTIPLIIMVLLFQRQIVAGLTQGAVKG